MMEILNKKAKEAMKDVAKWTHVSEDEPMCVLCEKRIIDDVPLRLFNLEENTEIDFHVDCATGGE